MCLDRLILPTFDLVFGLPGNRLQVGYTRNYLFGAAFIPEILT